MAVAAVAIIGKANNPLYIKSLRNDAGLQFHHIVHTSLDVIEESIDKTRGSASGSLAANFLGMLYPTQEYKVYGYLTSTLIKFVLVLDYSCPARDAETKSFFTRLHRLYADVVCNPFYTLDSSIQSPAFERQLDQLLAKGL
mmetsp:Transcript_18222/g.20266  ORF Transcript_18222/g.20266 Transcript_18222/m.20266 type:complete len:141 (-) Transcript_18222:72-494(-)